MKSCATDFDLLVSRGFDPKEVRGALATCHGDMRRAQLWLAQKNDCFGSGWSAETDGDWVNHTPSNALPVYQTNRALWKSPIYVRVASCSRTEGDIVLFTINIVLKDGQQLERKKRLSQFIAFHDSLPSGAISHLKSNFPKRNLLPWKHNNHSMEKKRVLLEEWMRELCMDEVCMQSQQVLQSLYKFLDIESSARPPEAPAGPRVVQLADYKEDWISIPERNLARIPALSNGMPCKIRVSTVFSDPDEFKMMDGLLQDGADESDKQLAKDYSRDRLIINERRIAGSQWRSSTGGNELTVLAEIMSIAEETAQAVLVSAGFPDSFSPDVIKTLCKRALRRASRTHSAFLCLTALHNIVDMSVIPDVCIVPESTLAMPVVLKFAVSAPPIPQAPPVLRCEIQASTVYRFCTGDALKTVLQVKTVFCKTLREMPLKKDHAKQKRPSSGLLRFPDFGQGDTANLPPSDVVESGSPNDDEVAKLGLAFASKLANSSSPRGGTPSSAPSPTTPPAEDNSSPMLKYQAAFAVHSFGTGSERGSESEAGDDVSPPSPHKKLASSSPLYLPERVKGGECDSDSMICLIKETTTTLRDWQPVG